MNNFVDILMWLLNRDTALIFTVTLVSLTVVIALLVTTLFIKDANVKAIIFRSVAPVVMLATVSDLLILIVLYVPKWRVNEVVPLDATATAIQILESIKYDALNYYNTNFVNLVSVCSLLFVVFGIGFPFLSFLLQRKNLSDERDIINKCVDDKLRDLSEKLISKQDKFDRLDSRVNHIDENLKHFDESVGRFDKGYIRSINTMMEIAIAYYKVSTDDASRLGAMESYFRNLILLIEYGVERRFKDAIHDADICRLKDVITLFSERRGLLADVSDSIIPELKRIDKLTLCIVYGPQCCDRLVKELSVIFPDW